MTILVFGCTSPKGLSCVYYPSIEISKGEYNLYVTLESSDIWSMMKPWAKCQPIARSTRPLVAPDRQGWAQSLSGEGQITPVITMTTNRNPSVWCVPCLDGWIDTGYVPVTRRVLKPGCREDKQTRMCFWSGPVDRNRVKRDNIVKDVVWFRRRRHLTPDASRSTTGWLTFYPIGRQLTIIRTTLRKDDWKGWLFSSARPCCSYTRSTLTCLVPYTWPTYVLCLIPVWVASTHVWERHN